MNRQFIVLRPWDWEVEVYYSADRECAKTILTRLVRCGVSGKILESAGEVLGSGDWDCGFTYTNPEMRKTVMVIGRTSSSEQFWNTLDHEKGHVVEHISEALGMPHEGEERQYLAGELAGRLYGRARKFICGCDE